MLDHRISITSINNRIRSCKVFFAFLLRQGIIETDIASELRSLRDKRYKMHTFTKEQVETILQQPDQSTFTGFRDYVMMPILLYTGIRLKELSGLTVQEIDFEQQQLRVQTGKGRKARLVPATARKISPIENSHTS